MTAQNLGKLKKILMDLNEVQLAAVECPPGPVLVLAGAGSGKTRVLTSRIALLLSRFNVQPHEILSVTFTNKSAKEMKTRLRAMVNADFSTLWVGTFHSVFARILRRESVYIGYGRNFSIFDSDDQLQTIKRIMKDLSISIKDYSPKLVRGLISRYKNEMKTPEQVGSAIADRFDEVLFKVYSQYKGLLKSNNAMDFDDLITLPVNLFKENPKVLEKYQDRFQHILVDEYQDTNVSQNELIKLLGLKNKNVFVVGDDDQSIYRWRGAEVQNILNFEKSFPNCEVFRLEQNYRSTKTILAAAYSVVKNNYHRTEKRLWTEGSHGDPLVLMDSYNESDEASKILNRIRHEISNYKRNFQDFVVLYRTNSQSRAIEDALRRNAISYEIVGGTKFYDRKEIKDFLAYLRIVANPKDELSLRRIINVPVRGIGAATINKLQDYSENENISLINSLGKVDETSGISPKARDRLKELGVFFEKYFSLKDTLGFDEFARVMNDEIGFLRMFKEDGSLEAMNRFDNLQELLSAISEYCENREEPNLDGFLEEVALVTELDNWNEQSNAVTLMTIHSAKGLEFPVVFISGLEEGLFPLSRSKEDPDDFEEERRLFYVGLTRAKEKVYLSWAQNRRRFIEGAINSISSFVDEIDPEYIERLVPKTVSIHKPVYQGLEYEPIPDYENESQEQSLYVGCLVKHDLFGTGKIQAMEGTGQDLKLAVLFEGIGTKKLLYKYAQLEIM